MDRGLWEGCGRGGAGAGHQHGGRSQRLQWMRPYCEFAREELGAGVHGDRLGGIADDRGSHSMLIGVARTGWVWLRRPTCQEPEQGHGAVLGAVCIGGAKARLDQPLGMDG